MKKISFFDGFTSGTTPDESIIKANEFVDFTSTAAYEAEYGSPVDGSAFFNTTTNLINYYNGSAWVALDSTNPMTTNGDIITQAGGVPARVGIGAVDTVLYSNGSAPSWLAKSTLLDIPFIEYINTSGSPTLVSGANTVIDYNYAIHTDTSYFTVTTGASWNAKVLQNGLYLILASINITANATGARVFNLTAGGVVEDVDARPGTATTNHTLKTAVMVKLSTNDTIYTDLFQNSGSNLFNVTPNQANKIVIARIGD